jgi:FkbM family methyltransferase
VADRALYTSAAALADPSPELGPAGTGGSQFRNTLLFEVLRDCHRYAPGIGHHRPAIVDESVAPPRGRLWSALERSRDAIERLADRAGFARRHFDPAVAAEHLERYLQLADRFEATYAGLSDEQSRRRLVDLLKLRILGPYHSSLRVTPDGYRARQRYADDRLRREHGTFEVSDPWFSPLSLYELPVKGGANVKLHSHSVDVVSVYLLEQYSYQAGVERVSVEPGDVVLDIGGCWGDTALYFASLVGPAGRVYTFEFDPESLEIMRANLALNPDLAERIEVVESALWDRSGELLPFVQGGRMTAVVSDGADAARSVATVTLDEFVEQRGIERVDFVKMDVEGAEPNVLRGGAASLRRFGPRLAIAAYHADDDLVELPGLIASLEVGYRFFLDSFSPVEAETVLFARP